MPLRISQKGSSDETQIEIVEEEQVEPWPKDPPLAIVGKSHPRLEGNQKVTGRARYT